MPGGEPPMLEQLAARLEIAAQGAGTLADSTSQVTGADTPGASATACSTACKVQVRCP